MATTPIDFQAQAENARQRDRNRVANWMARKVTSDDTNVADSYEVVNNDTGIAIVTGLTTRAQAGTLISDLKTYGALNHTFPGAVVATDQTDSPNTTAPDTTGDDSTQETPDTSGEAQNQ